METDEDVVELVKTMDNLLNFVEDTEHLKAKLQRFVNVIEEILRTIRGCCTLIDEYANSSAAGTLKIH